MAVVSIPGWESADDSLNAVEFARLRDHWLANAQRSLHPEGQRLARALERGDRELDPPLVLRVDEIAQVVADSPDARTLRLVLLRRKAPSAGGAYEVFAHNVVLVRGRAISLEWIQRGLESVGVLAEARDRMSRWTEAVVAANP